MRKAFVQLSSIYFLNQVWYQINMFSMVPVAELKIDSITKAAKKMIIIT